MKQEEPPLSPQARIAIDNYLNKKLIIVSVITGLLGGIIGYAISGFVTQRSMEHAIEYVTNMATEIASKKGEMDALISNYEEQKDDIDQLRVSSQTLLAKSQEIIASNADSIATYLIKKEKLREVLIQQMAEKIPDARLEAIWKRIGSLETQINTIPDDLEIEVTSGSKPDNLREGDYVAESRSNYKNKVVIGMSRPKQAQDEWIIYFADLRIRKK